MSDQDFTITTNWVPAGPSNSPAANANVRSAYRLACIPAQILTVVNLLLLVADNVIEVRAWPFLNHVVSQLEPLGIFWPSDPATGAHLGIHWTAAIGLTLSLMAAVLARTSLRWSPTVMGGVLGGASLMVVVSVWSAVLAAPLTTAIAGVFAIVTACTAALAVYRLMISDGDPTLDVRQPSFIWLALFAASILGPLGAGRAMFGAGIQDRAAGVLAPDKSLWVLDNVWLYGAGFLLAAAIWTAARLIPPWTSSRRGKTALAAVSAVVGLAVIMPSARDAGVRVASSGSIANPGARVPTPNRSPSSASTAFTTADLPSLLLSQEFLVGRLKGRVQGDVRGMSAWKDIAVKGVSPKACAALHVVSAQPRSTSSFTVGAPGSTRQEIHQTITMTANNAAAAASVQAVRELFAKCSSETATISGRSARIERRAYTITDTKRAALPAFSVTTAAVGGAVVRTVVVYVATRNAVSRLEFVGPSSGGRAPATALISAVTAAVQARAADASG